MLRLTLLLSLVCLSLVAIPAASAMAAPSATTGDASEISYTMARLHGTVTGSSAGAAVQYRFEYGPTDEYGSQTSTEWEYGGSGGDVSHLVGGLTQGTVYHYRVVAISGGETVYGGDRTFTTTAPSDRDGDGFPDNGDSCPDQPGGPQGQYNGPGCPAPGDSDGDGYVDPEDNCPGQAGGPQGRFNATGCPPPPDDDGDGYIGIDDACPDRAGGPEGPGHPQGCPPPPDTDGDGFRNHGGAGGDQCPEQPGPAASEHNSGRTGCPEADGDGDGLPDHRDECPDEIPASWDADLPIDARGCLPFSVNFSIDKTRPPTIKEFLKDGYSGNLYVGYGGGPHIPGKPLVRMKATMAVARATARKLKLKSPVIDTSSDVSAKTSEDPEGGGRYAFWKFKPSAAVKKRLAKLKGLDVTIVWVLTDAEGKKYTYRTTADLGTKVRPKEPVLVK